MLEQIIHNDKLLAIIIKNEYSKDGVEFFTPNDFSQQLAYMSHKKGKVIDAHTHNIIPREVNYTKEVLVIRKGKLRVDFYENNQTYIKSREISQGDVILLAYGGHGFEVIEDCEMIEIKQGPFLGEKDKVRFEGIKSKAVVKND